MPARDQRGSGAAPVDPSTVSGVKTPGLAVLLVAGCLSAACGGYQSGGPDTVTFSGAGESGSDMPTNFAQRLNGGDYDVSWSVQANPDLPGCDFIAKLVHRPERPDRSYATESTDLVRVNIAGTAASGMHRVYGITGADYIVEPFDSTCGAWQVALASR